jgi:hypothetical protein
MSSFQKTVLVRILGNDLPPCHSPNQTLTNVSFILQNEPPLPQCSKHWIINRIVDVECENKLIGLLQSYGQSITRIPFNIDEYMALPEQETFYYPIPWFKFAKKRRLSLYFKRKRLNYVTNINFARNRAIEYGQEIGEYIFPWDGNCIVTANSWADILSSINSKKPYYVVVPMFRAQSNNSLFFSNDSYPSLEAEEPQLGFSSKSQSRFNESIFYGRRDKVEMLWRLCVPGPWDRFVDEPWDIARQPPSNDRHMISKAGWVYRLDSGRPGARNSGRHAAMWRNRRREIACLSLLKKLDSLATQR